MTLSAMTHRRRTRSPGFLHILFTVVLTSALALSLPDVLGGTSPALAATPKTLISLTFDDGNDNQFAAEQVMKAHGLVGTFFITTSWIGSPAYLTQTNLRSMAADGNEIGGHTVTHPDLTTVSAESAAAEVCNGRNTLTSWGFTVNNFAYPFASENPSVEKIVKSCGYASARNLGDIRSPASCGSCPYAETIPPGNLYNTAAPDEVDSSWTLKNLQDFVTNAESHGGGWVQLTFHHIAVGTDPSLTISPTLFEQFVTWLAARRANGTTVVQTVAQALAQTTPPPVNKAPVAAFSSTSTNLATALDGSGSSDPDGTLSSYSWNFGDGSASGSGAKPPPHVYAAAGTYQVLLTVTDNQGATGTVMHPVTVTAAAAPTTPAAPTSVTVKAGNASAAVSWTAPSSGGSPITRYIVTPYVGAIAHSPIFLAPTTTSTTVTGLANGTTYTFTVTAANAVGTSPATRSAAVTPTAPAVVTVANGGFESGLTSWSTGGVAAPRLVTRAHTGAKSVLLGVNGGREPLGDSTLAQTILVPATGTANLSFWYQPHTNDRTCNASTACQRDWMEGQVRSSGGAKLATLFKLNNNRGAWTRLTANLTAFRGQRITLWFNVHLNGPNPDDDTWMYLDDVVVSNS